MSKGGSIRDVDRGMNKFLREIRRAEQMVVDVGVQAGSTTEDGQDLATIAAHNEFGTARIPSRPFMRSSFDENVGKINAFAQDALGRVSNQTMTADQALNLIGQMVTGIIQEKIVEGPWVPNAPETIKRKRSAKPLIDTGRLRQSIRHVVRRKP